MKNIRIGNNNQTNRLIQLFIIAGDFPVLWMLYTLLSYLLLRAIHFLSRLGWQLFAMELVL